MNNIVWININSDNYYKLFSKISNIGIDIYDSKIYSDHVLIKILYKDYKRLKKYLVSYNISLYSYTGKYKYIDLFKKNIIYIITCFISIIVILLCNNLVFKVEINSSSKYIKDLLSKEINNHHIGVVSFKKDHKVVELIVKDILDNNKDTLEWLEIKYDGLIMIINVTERSKEIKKEEDQFCNVIAKKDAKIISMNVYRGEIIKDINDYVNKGDIILSGDIIHNEEVKNRVCADGIIYGEVWYLVHVRIPYKEEINKLTGKVRYNLNIVVNNKKYDIFKKRLNNSIDEYINLYKLNNFEINIVKEKEYTKDIKILTKEEAYKKGINKVKENINKKLNENEEIIMQKVLKKEEFDSTIYIEVFVVTKEVIGTVLKE